MSVKVAISKGTTVLTCGHSPLEKILVDPKGKPDEDTVLLCLNCFAVFLSEGELNVTGSQYLLDEDIMDKGPSAWS